MRKYILVFFALFNSVLLSAQINTDRVTLIGRNALYFEDYLLAIQYFNQVIKAKPYLAEPYYYRAIAKYYLDDFKGTEDDCTQCINYNSFLTGAYQLRADARQNQKKYDGALDDYKESLKTNPDDKFILVNMGIVNIEKKDLETAEMYLDQLVLKYPNYVQGILTRGSLYLEKQDTLKALDNYTTAIEKDKYFAPSYAMRASTYLAKKDYDKALADYDESIKIDPLLVGTYINRGLTRYYKNDLRGAMSDYDHVIEMESFNIIAHFNRALLRAQVGDDNKAIRDFDFVIENEPENYIAYMNRGLLKNNIGDRRGALADINRVLTEYPDFYQGFYLRSEIKRKQNDLRSAEQDYLHARKLEDRLSKSILFNNKSPKSKDSGKIREKSDKTIDKFNLLVVADKGEAERSKYNSETRGKIQNKQANIELESSFIVSYYERQNDLYKFIRYNSEVDDINKKGQLNRKLVVANQEVPLDSAQVTNHFESINKYSKLIVEQPSNPVLYLARGLDYMLVQDFVSAIEDLTKATNLNPAFTLAYFNLAVAYTKQVKARESLPELYNQQPKTELSISMQLGTDKVVSSSSTTPQVSELESKAMRARLEYELILKNYAKVIELSPNFTYAYYNRAEIKSLQNDYRAAILDYNEVIKRDSEFAEAYYNRGLCRLHIKDTERGLDDFRKSGELGMVNAYSIIKRMTD
ncbi:MAG: hypothetical protein RL662_2465 [Bacteroidota bacterium]